MLTRSLSKVFHAVMKLNQHIQFSLKVHFEIKLLIILTTVFELVNTVLPNQTKEEKLFCVMLIAMPIKIDFPTQFYFFFSFFF